MPQSFYFLVLTIVACACTKAPKHVDLIVQNAHIWANLPLSTWSKLAKEVQKNGRGDDWVKIGGLKGFVDGSLGSHTTAMTAIDLFTSLGFDFQGLLHQQASL